MLPPAEVTTVGLVAIFSRNLVVIRAGGRHFLTEALLATLVQGNMWITGKESGFPVVKMAHLRQPTSSLSGILDRW